MVDWWYVGNEAALITVRDEGSLEELRRLHILRPPQEVTADPVLAMHPVDKGLGRVILKRHGLEGTAPLVGLAIREWPVSDGCFAFDSASRRRMRGKASASALAPAA